MIQSVVIKSSKNGINLVLDPDEPFEELLKEVKKKFIESEKFFRNASIAITFDGRTLSEAQQFQIIETIEKNTTIHILCIFEENAVRDELIRRQMEAVQEQLDTAVKDFDIDTGRFYHGTLRSGQQIDSETSVVVIGDVNPGAVVNAKGNIVILGALKGMANAGSDGNDRCFVAALEMDPMQIKIGSYMGRSADRRNLGRPRKKVKEEQPVPQIATVYEKQILIEPITKGLLKNI